MHYQYFNSVILGLCLLLAGAACGDNNKLISQQNGEIQPETEASLRAWVDGQDVIIAPWSHEVDGEVLDAALIEDERISFVDGPENQWLLELPSGSIIHGYSYEHLIGVMRRVESVEKDNDRIIVSTRMASLEELYLKLVSGTDLEAASSKQALSHESAQGELRVKEQELSRYWSIPDTQLIGLNKSISGGLCYGSTSNGRLGNWRECTLAFGGISNDTLDQPDFKSSDDIGFGVDAKVKQTISVNGGHLSIDIEFGRTRDQNAAVCMTRHFSLIEQMITMIRHYFDEGVKGQMVALFREFGAYCGDFKPSLFKYDLWHRNKHADIVREGGGFQQLESFKDAAPAIYAGELIGFMNEVSGNQNSFQLVANLDFELGLDPLRLFMLYRASSQTFSYNQPLPFSLRVPIAAGPVVVTHVLSSKLVFEVKASAKGGVEWRGAEATALKGNVKLRIDWTPSDGFSYDVDVSNDSRFLGKPELFGDIGAEVTLGLPIDFSALLYESIGPTLTLEPYISGGFTVSNSTNTSVQRKCEWKLNLGTKASISGDIKVPIWGKSLGRLTGLLFDACDPQAADAWLPDSVIRALPAWLCPVELSDNRCPRTADELYDNSWLTIEAGNYNTAQRRSPESEKASVGILDVDHIWLERVSDGTTHFPTDVTGAVVAPDKLAFSEPHMAAENMRFHALNELLRPNMSLVCLEEANYTTIPPTEDGWETHGLSISGADVARIKFPVKLESGDKIILDRHLYGYCMGGGTATLAVGDLSKSNFGPKIVSQPFADGRLELIVKDSSECLSSGNIICLPTMD